MKPAIVTMIVVLLLLPATLTGQSSAPPAVTASGYEPSSLCRNCHPETFAQYNQSRHAKSFTNPLFWAQYFKEVVPRAERSAAYRPVAKRCIFCHSPVLFMNSTGLIRFPDQAFLDDSGVTCDFCHTFDGYADDGTYRKDSSGKKQGPYEQETSWHGQKSNFIQISEFCGYCHNSANHLGAEVKVTYDEWKNSRFPDSFITCQECHMSKHGYVENNRGKFDRGTAAYLNIGWLQGNQAPQRDKLHSHQFPGATSEQQLQGAATLSARVGKTRLPDGRLILGIEVENSRGGHKLPSGSTDLRIVWLEVTARTADGREATVRHFRSGKNGGTNYGIAGMTPEDGEILAGAVPEGSRIYRAIFVDREERRTATFIDAVRIAFDNRLGPAEVRREQYTVSLPPGYDGLVEVRSRLCYLNAPPSFTRRLGLPDFQPVVIAEDLSFFNLSPKEKREPAQWLRSTGTGE